MWSLKIIEVPKLPELLDFSWSDLFLIVLGADEGHGPCCSMFKMLQQVCDRVLEIRAWSVCLGWCMTTCTGWLFLSECSTSLLWQFIVVYGTEDISPTTVRQSRSSWSPDVINSQFRQFAVAPLGLVYFLLPTNNLEFTAWSSAGSSCWLRTH